MGPRRKLRYEIEHSSKNINLKVRLSSLQLCFIFTDVISTQSISITTLNHLFKEMIVTYDINEYDLQDQKRTYLDLLSTIQKIISSGQIALI
jgi:hypothetical protein